jgi:toxin FitB
VGSEIELVTDGTLIDTDVFIDHFRGAHPLRRPHEGRIACSIVTRAELFAGKHVDERAVREVLGAIDEIPVDQHVAETAGRLRRDHALRMGDAIIAASALTQRLELMTSNARDFERVPGLTIRKARG